MWVIAGKKIRATGNWTQQKLAWLSENASQYTRKELAEKLGQEEQRVNHMLRKLELKPKETKNRNDPIIDKRVRELWETHTAEEIAIQLHITRKRVWSVGSRLKLPKKPRDNSKGQCQKAAKAASLVIKEKAERRREEKGEQLRNPEFREMLKARYTKGDTIEQMRLALGYAYVEVKRVLQEEGTVLRDRGPRTLPTEWELTEDQIQLVIGSLLGDASGSTAAREGAISMEHSQGQKTFIDKKWELLRNWCNDPPRLAINKRDKRTGKEYFSYHFKTRSHPCFTKLVKLFYPGGGKKVVPLEALERLNKKGLAWWFGDDGSLGQQQYLLCTECFERENLLLVQRWFKNKWDLNPTLTRQGRLVFPSAECTKISKLIEKKMVEWDLDWKIPEARRELLRCKMTILGEQLLGIPIKDEDGNRREPPKEEVDYVLSLYRRFGFPIQRESDAVIRHRVNQLKIRNLGVQVRKLKDQRLVKHQAREIGVVNHYYPHIWEGRQGEAKTYREVYEDDKLMRKVIRSRYQQGAGLRPKDMRTGIFMNGGRCPRNYPPKTAKIIYEAFLSAEGGSVLDPCAGYGGRLLGALCTERVKLYVGVEPAQQTITCSRRMLKDLVEKGLVEEKATLVRNTAEEWCPERFKEAFDLIFTSPPYRDCEGYAEHETTQVSNRYSTREKYKEWAGLCLANWYKLAKPGATALVQVSNPFDKDEGRLEVVEPWEEAIEESVWERLPDIKYKGPQKGKVKIEVILVAYKPKAAEI